jgi:hypothetical protein
MPSRAPRIALTVPDDLDDLLERVSDLQGVPKTKVILNLLVELKPTLQHLILALEAVKANKDPSSILMSMTSHLLADLSNEISTFQASAKVIPEKKD